MLIQYDLKSCINKSYPDTMGRDLYKVHIKFMNQSVRKRIIKMKRRK